MVEAESKISISKSKVYSINCGPAPVYLVQFSNANCKLEKRKCLQFQSFRSSELSPLSKPKRVMAVSNCKLLYSGSNFESEMSQVTSSLLKVGVFNKESRTIKLYDADFFHLKPILKYSLDINILERTWQEKSEDLALAFGSKNKKRVITSRLKYQSTGNDSIESIVSSHLTQSSFENTNTNEVKQESDIIPPQNTKATCIDDIYNIYDIISEEEYCALDSQASVLTNISLDILHQWKSDNKFCMFIIHCLETKYQSISLHNAKLLCYLQFMISLLKCSYKELRKKDPIPDVPQPYKRKIIDCYVLNRTMPQRMKDKLLSHAMVLALTINNYHIDGNIWALSTQIPMKRLVLVAYALGCHVSDRKREDTKLIELKLPLYKYEPRVMKKK